MSKQGFLLILLFLLLMQAGGLYAQETTSLFVLTKKVEKTFSYVDGYEVNIEGEKAEVIIRTWNKKAVQVQMELLAKHPQRAIAERDLEYLRHQAERVQHRIYLRNYLSAPEGAAKPEASFDARYTIYLPPECPVYTKNQFGAINVSDLARRLRVKSEFTQIGLENIRGEIDVNTAFGDLEGRRLDGQVSIQSRRSNITLRELRGQYDIQAQYGLLRIHADRDLIDLNIRADRSDVFLYNSDPRRFAYTIEAQNAKLDLPSELEFRFQENNLSLKKATFKPNQEYYANITITISFGDLVIEK